MSYTASFEGYAPESYYNGNLAWGVVNDQTSDMVSAFYEHSEEQTVVVQE